MDPKKLVNMLVKVALENPERLVTLLQTLWPLVEPMSVEAVSSALQKAATKNHIEATPEQIAKLATVLVGILDRGLQPA